LASGSPYSLRILREPSVYSLANKVINVMSVRLLFLRLFLEAIYIMLFETKKGKALRLALLYCA
jgi:hypothetical protein